MHRFLGCGSLSGCLTVAAAWIALSAAAQAADLNVVAAGLDNPRGLAFGAQGALYVVEAGRGGNGACVIGGEGSEVCFGASGAITRVKDGVQSRIVTGLPSLAAPNGAGATGPTDIALRSKGRAYVVVGLGGNPTQLREELGPEGSAMGQLLRVDLGSGRWRAIVDISGHEAAHNPAGGTVDSNPYALLPVGSGAVVADAGGNDLLRVRNKGGISTLATFADRLADAPPFLGLPPGAQIPMQPVPTSVIQGPDGAYYVGELTGFPFPQRAARILRVQPGREVEVFATGFTNIIDLAIGPDGQLYVLEISHKGLLSGDPTGALLRLNPDGSRDAIVKKGLTMPGGLAFGPDGAAYVTNCSPCPAGAGQVLRSEF